jgi:hypothetical protein
MTKAKRINKESAAHWLRALADCMNARRVDEPQHRVRKQFVLGESAGPFLRRIADAIEHNDWVRGTGLTPAQRLRIDNVAHQIDHRPPGLSIKTALELAACELARDWGFDHDAEEHVVGQIAEARKRLARLAREQGRARPRAVAEGPRSVAKIYADRRRQVDRARRPEKPASRSGK